MRTARMDFSYPGGISEYVMRRGWLSLLLLVIVAGSYLNALPGVFLYDDYPLMLENPLVTGEEFDYSSFLYHHGGRPLTLWSFHFNYHLFGGDPAGFHLTNILLHGMVVVLLFIFIAAVTSRVAVAFVAAALFAVHPAQVQAVSYVWSRSLLLMSLFLLLALLVQRPWLRLAFFQLAILSRAEALVALVPLIWMNPRRWKGLVLLVSVNLGCFVTGFLVDNPSGFGWNYPNPLSYWLTSAQTFWQYLQHTLFPFSFSIYHSPMKPGLLSPLATGAFLIGVILLWTKRKQWPQMAIGSGWFLLFLIPGLAIPSSSQYSESRLYFALAGICFLGAYGLAWIFKKDAGWVPAIARHDPDTTKDGVSLEESRFEDGLRSRWAMYGLRSVPVLILLLALSAATQNRNALWQSEIAIWEEAVSLYPEDFLPHYNLAVAFARQGLTDKAKVEFQRSSDLNHLDYLSYAGLGYCAESRGAWSEALVYYDAALEINPESRYANDSRNRVVASISAEKGGL
jgi:tetratricopeptide (TPR) repeat protein